MDFYYIWRLWWSGCQAASRCYQNRTGPKSLDLHHHGDLVSKQTTHRRDITPFKYMGEDTRKEIIHREERERKHKDITQDRDMRRSWTPAEWGTRSKTLGNCTTAREAERFQDECWSSKTCLRDKGEQEEKKGERRREEKVAHSSDVHVLVKQTS